MTRFLAAAALALSLAFPALAQDSVVATPDLSGFERQVHALYGKTLAILDADFPEDRAAFETRLDDIRRSSLSTDEKLTAAFLTLSDIRLKYAAQLQFAPEDDLRRVLIFLADFYVAVLEGAGPQACGRFASDGAAVLFDAGIADDFAVQLDEQSVAFFTAVVGAIENPEYHDAANAADWELVTGAMLNFGGTKADIARVAKGDPADPDLCKSLIGLFRTIAVLDTAEGGRTRADFAKNATGY